MCSMDKKTKVVQKNVNNVNVKEKNLNLNLMTHEELFEELQHAQQYVEKVRSMLKLRVMKQYATAYESEKQDECR